MDQNALYPSMITSKLTSKAQTTIPQAIRSALSLREGDEVAYTIEGDRVMMRKAPAAAATDDPFGVFDEWGGEADRKAYSAL